MTMGTFWCDKCKKFVPHKKMDALYDKAGNVKEWLCVDCKKKLEKESSGEQEFLPPAEPFTPTAEPLKPIEEPSKLSEVTLNISSTKKSEE